MAGAHNALAEFGCVIEPKGSGMVVTTTLTNSRVLAAKASLLGRWASKASLERTLGPYVPAAGPHRRTDPRRTYEQFIQRERLVRIRMRGSHDDGERLVRRAERAKARRQLAERFVREQARLRERRRAERKALRRRQEAERCTLSATHREQRRRLRALSQAPPRRDGPLALALWAFVAAREREVLQRRQATERRELTDTLPRAEVWYRWVERRTEQGDLAAQAALRGIRYRERRKRHQEAIAGEEVSAQRPFTVVGLRANVDTLRHFIVYRRADGSEVFRDVGPRLVMRNRGDESLEAALRIAAQKYGGRVRLMSGEPFRERAARMATRFNIVVENAELQGIVREERLRVAERWGEPRIARTFSRTNPYRPRHDRSRGLER